MPEDPIDLRQYLEQQIADVRRAAEIALAASNVEGVPLRQYIEAIIEEKDRALSMAGEEREKAAQALAAEQQRALDQAGRERDKAAQNLRIELARAINEGDERLREHIHQQFQQINAALVSAEKLEKERFQAAKEATHGLEGKLEVLRVAAATEQSKFEDSVRERFATVNEFRASLDDLGKQMATRRELESATTSSGARFDEVQKAMQELRSRIDVGPAELDKLRERADLQAGRQAGVGVSAGVLAGSIAALATIIGLVVVLANLVTSGGP